MRISHLVAIPLAAALALDVLTAPAQERPIDAVRSGSRAHLHENDVRPRLDREALDAYIERARLDWQVPGIAVAAIQDGAVVYQRGFGVREIDKVPRVDERSLFEIGSLTKAFTATAVALLVDEGRISWDDLVIDHLPTFRLADPWLTEHVTIRDLLAHRAGVESNVSAVVPMSAAQVLGNARTARAWVSFRDEALYSNMMYNIAGELIAAVSGMSWAEFVQRRLLDPLGLHDSSPSADLAGVWDAAHLAPSMYGQAPAGRAGIEDATGRNVTMPHWHTPKGPKALPWQISLRGGAPTGSMVSNLHDLSLWLRFNLNEGRDQAGRPLLSAATLQELRTPQIMIRDPTQFSFSRVWEAVNRISPTTERVSYAMGWFHHTYRGHRYLYHGGALLGGMSLIAMIPDRGTGVIVLANSYGRDGSGLLNDVIALRIFDALLGAQSHDWSRDLLAVAEQEEHEAEVAEAGLQRQRRRGVPPSLPLQRYVGEYENPAFGRAAIVLAGDRLVFRKPGVVDWRLEHWHGDIFRMHVSTSGVDLMRFFLRFHIDPQGQPASFDPGWDLLGGPFMRVSSAR